MSGGLDRRAFLGLGAGALAASLLAVCVSDDRSVGADPGATSRPANAGTGPSTTTAAGAATTPVALTAADFDGVTTCRLLPEKTAGPFPLDRQFDRRDVTEGLPGQPLRLGLRVVDVHCEPVAAAVEIWQCDATGDYSAFQDGGGGKDAAAGTTFLRGTQTAGADGIVEFASIYPGWYRGRAVHIHLRVHHDDETILTSQLFFPDDYTDEVYRAVLYARFGTPDTRNADDGIAGDPRAEGTLLAVRAAETGRGAGTLALVNLGGGGLMDLTEAATPAYFATMGIEHQILKRRAARLGPSAADYERNDTRTSLGMGVLSLVAPVVAAKVLSPLVPGRGKYGKALVATALGAAAVTTVADRLVARAERAADPATETRRRRTGRRARRVAAVTAPVAVAAGGVAITTTWLSLFNVGTMWPRRFVRDLGSGPVVAAAAILGWDFIYYWNHRFMHSSRYMWAIHVVHHSSERYNLSTALRQPVADALGTFAPYGLLCLAGIRPELIAQARGINLLYQYWIHTDTIPKLGPFETIFNTASHHRVHHGSNRQYLDRNHGSIFIVWDKLFGTFEREDETVVYGLTKNVNTYNLATVAYHEHRDMLRDVSRATNWSDRLAFVLRGPGWAYARHAAAGDLQPAGYD